MNHEFMMEYESFHTRVMILMNLLTSVLPTEFPVSQNSMLPIGYLSREVQRKPILDLELFVEKLIEPKIDLKQEQVEFGRFRVKNWSANVNSRL